ncbi:MAG: LysR family transcriptional regulator [Armatimonadetes bacterium]|nr:LysR family transcriptional regulator [Armatimonadota bacterium]
MDITIHHLRVFAEVARQGSFTRAAEALYVSQPAVSKSVRDLERQLRTPLFEQIGRRVHLTEGGRTLLAHASRVIAELADAERALAGLHEAELGRLSIGASNTPGTYLLPGPLGAFRQAHPGVEVVLQIGATREVLDRLIAGEVDLAVVGEAQFPAALIAEPYVQDTLALILAPSHPLATRPHVDLAALAGEPFVLRPPGSSTREVLERALAGRQFRPRVVMELGSTEAVKKAVGAGLGISFLSQYAVELELQAGALVTRPVAGLDLCRGIYTVRRASLPLVPLYGHFLAALRRGTTRGNDPR